ncbi:NTF2-like protein [Microthyrium microscopicum]|uniref:NTF2-like protein n=1 Tax=Microthyrium microscopicum TaxID=703497 RepID=A0A6A6UGV8_9PEZI|nr:NTF2-like protein [Microthyrium microscopicum]
MPPGRPDPDLTAADAATTFATNYYNALRDSRSAIKNYYCEPAADSAIKVPRIIWNGNEIPDVDAMQKLFVDEMPPTFYEVQAVDAQVLNSRYFPDLGSDRNISIAVTVAGFLRLEHPKTGPLHEFSENFILIPNRAKLMNKGVGQSKRDWLIQNQIFRYVVTHDPIETAGWTTTMEVDAS